jgi:hypothetical protein
MRVLLAGALIGAGCAYCLQAPVSRGQIAILFSFGLLLFVSQLLRFDRGI